MSDIFHVRDYGQRWAMTLPQEQDINQQLPADAWNFVITQQGVYFSPAPIVSDQLLDLPETVTDRIVEEVKSFFSEKTKAAFARYKFMHRRGILMYGRPGTGKSCAIYKIINWARQNGIVVLVDIDVRRITTAITTIRRVTPAQPVIVILEELEEHISSAETLLLQILDGAQSIESVVFLATTNFINKIPDRIKNRPSRFATLVEVGPPNATARRLYLEAKLHSDDLTTINMDQWVAATEGMVLDEIKDLIINVFCLGIPLDQISKVKLGPITMCNECDKELPEHEAWCSALDNPLDDDPDDDDDEQCNCEQCVAERNGTNL